MNELELTRALYLQLAEQDQRLVVKKAAEKGFVVDGFSKNVSKAPPRAVCACMAKRARRGKYPYQFILSAMAEQQKVDEENIIYYLAGEWMKGEYTHAGVEEDLKKLIHNKKESDNTIKDNEKSQKDLQNQECKYKEESEVESAALKKELERLDQELLITKDKTKKYKNTIQEYKIEIDNLQKNILREEKAKDRLFRQIGELENELEKVQEEKNEEIRKQKIREYEIRELQNQVETLMQQIKDLEIYRRHAPKLLCIVKSKNKIEIPGYNIKMAHEWNEVIREEAVNGEYFEVWLVQKQFPYHLVNEISECIGKKLKQFLTVEDLMNTVSQGGKKMTQTEDRQIIGVLVSDEELKNNSVFINRSSAIQYTLKSLSIPQEEMEYFTGYLSSFEDEIEFEDDTYLEDAERSEIFRDWIGTQLLIFSYKTGGDFAKVRKANLVAKPNAFDINMRFYAVPVFAAEDDRIIMDWCNRQRFNLWRDYKSLGEFQNYIYEKRSVGSLYGYDLESFKPSFVVWKDIEGKLYAIGGITDITYDSLGGIILEGSDIFKVNISDYIKFAVYDMNANPTIIFVPEAIYKDIEDAILKDSVAQKKAGKSFEEKVKTVEKTDIREVNEFSNEKLIEIDISEKTDELIINSMDYHSQRDGLYYSMRDFVNVHTAIKCSSLVILSGLSGTGKSQLVEVYAKALGIEDRLLVIPVRPSWNDDADLLGYVDLVHMVYRPSDTGFVDLLVSAQNNSDKMYLVCFDEMNLARVEHYFSQFLSILERQKRELQLYDEQYIGRLYNSKDYPYKIKIGDNIRFVGTVNVDESTYHFSDKVLDRANVIQLNVLNYATEWKNKPYATKRPVTWSSDDYARLLVKGSTEHQERLHKLLWDIHQLMQCASTKYGIGPRIVKSIEIYMNNLPQETVDNYDHRTALDYQVVQRVLTKVRGPESQLGVILDRNSANNFERIFDQYQDLSDFEKCRKIIIQKQKELKAYGYCI